ncbi:MAG: dihydroorotate dehydrogenase (fumarate) [Parcubacteria group bacterium Gr01-1014_29]|nr:MAG: dihydroorotate dehydrogenase (fumarate) [Parcubacteria group bacterium Gr01-1014_29]
MNNIPFRLRVGNVLWQKGIQPYLFRKDPEEAHVFTIKTLREIQRSGLIPLIRFLFHGNHAHEIKNMTLVGDVVWRNKVGLAAGFDKNAEVMAVMDAFGFGSQEVGTIVPQPQKGNPKPRVFRYPKNGAIVNKYGFNSDGAIAVAENIRNTHARFHITCPIGVSLGKNKDTPDERAVDDYVSAFTTMYPVLRPGIDYIKINISSPNTPGLRALFDRLDEFLAELFEKISLIATWDVPIYLKVPPDGIAPDQYRNMVETAVRRGITALEATNTTSNPALKKEYGITEEGGLSGEPLRTLANDTLRILSVHAKAANRIDLIGVGGISCGEHAREKIELGAKAVQIYTGLVFRGPILIHEILEKLHTV